MSAMPPRFTWVATIVASAVLLAPIGSIERNPGIPDGFLYWTVSGTTVTQAVARTGVDYWIRNTLTCAFFGDDTFLWMEPMRMRATTADQYYYKITGRPTGLAVWPAGGSRCSNTTGASSVYSLAAGATKDIRLNFSATPNQNLDGTFTVELWADTWGSDYNADNVNFPGRTDVTPPITPLLTLQNLTATAVTLQVDSTDSRSGLYGVRVVFDGSLLPGDGQYLGIFKTQRQFPRTALAAGSLHTFAVESFDLVGNKAAASPLSFYTLAAPFGKSSPGNGTGAQPTTVPLTWGPSSGLDNIGYQYCIDTTNNSQCDPGWTTTSNRNASPNLAPGTTYYWQVQARNPIVATTDADSGTWWSFTTQVSPPGAFNKFAPQNATSGQSTSPTLTWGTSSGATAYEYCYDTTNDNSCSNWTAGASGTALSSLNTTTTYYWQVRAANSSGTPVLANGGTWWSFTTQGSPAPGAFNKSAPGDAASGQSTNPTLTWGTSSGATAYEYCYDTTNDNSCSNWTAGSSGIALTNLNTNTAYYWQVRATNNGGTPVLANDGTWWSFTTQMGPPGAFNKFAPQNATSGQSTSPTLTWGTSSGATAYEYCYDTTNDNSCSNWTAGSSGTALSSVNTNTTYYWQVRATNNSGTQVLANGGTWWSFTTQGSPAPGAFNKSAPGDATSGNSASLTLEWGSSSGAISYEYCYDTSNDGDCSHWIADSSGTAISGLAAGTIYYWQVRANNNSGTPTFANQGSWWSFTTEDQVVSPPGAFSKTGPGKGSLDQSINTALTWGTSSGAGSYEYCYDTSNDDQCSTWQTGPSGVVLTGLQYSTTYYWQVRALKSGAVPTYADFGDWWSFVTHAAAPPGAFNKLTPENNATGQPTTLALNWGTSTGATSYEYCYDTTNDSQCSEWSSGSSGVFLSSLTSGTTYYWQVRSRNDSGAPTFANSDTWWVFTTSSATQAVHSSSLGIPVCATTSAACDSANLLIGRDSMTGGAEVHQPNNLASSCPDGSGGVFHSDESIDRIVVTSLDGAPFSKGTAVRVSVTVWAYSQPQFDALDFYYSKSASAPSWQFLETMIPTDAGPQVLETSYVLPIGQLQAVRTVFRYNVPAGACPGGVFTDVDDLVFAVRPAAFLDDELVKAGTPIQAYHVNELRQRIDALRITHGLGGFTWTDANLKAPDIRIKAEHMTEMRVAVQQAYLAAGFEAPTFSDPPPSAGQLIRTVHIEELRAAVKAIE